jgi:V/A-type H+-transporting ATPase subunit I
MEKLAVIGLKSEKERLLPKLMDLGMVEITDQTSMLDDDEWKNLAKPDGDEEAAAALESEINGVEQAVELIKEYGTAKEPLIFTRRAVKKSDFRKVMARREEISGKVAEISDLGEKIHSLNDRLNRNNSDIASMTPWEKYDLPLDVSRTERTFIDAGVVPSSTDMGSMKEAIDAEGVSASVTEVNRDKDMIYVSVISIDSDHAKVSDKLKEYGFTPAQFLGRPGTVKDNIDKLKAENEELEADVEAAKKSIAEFEKDRGDIECYHDQLKLEYEREAVQMSMLQTEKTFNFEGWVPSKCKKKVDKALDEAGCVYEYREPEEGEEPPVLLKDTAFATPFQSIVQLYSLPDYHGFDPTDIMSVFYAMFFGIMMSDAGYGFVIALVCFILLKKFPVEGMTQKMLKTFFWSGVFTVFWGVLFGGYFGDLLPTLVKTFTGRTITIDPVWFNPLNDPTKLLIFSLILGVIHLFFGMGIDIYMKFRRHQQLDALVDDVSWMCIIAGCVMWLAGGNVSAALSAAGKYMTIGAAVFVLIFGGRHNKGLGKITGSLSALYNGITGNLSDILSYARLLALGLATGVIASVVNMLANMVAKGVVGIICMFLIMIVGHVFNIAVNMLGAYVHSSRLQYIEFFGRFYEDGGDEFKPFTNDTKYVKLVED